MISTKVTGIQSLLHDKDRELIFSLLYDYLSIWAHKLLKESFGTD